PSAGAGAMFRCSQLACRRNSTMSTLLLTGDVVADPRTREVWAQLLTNSIIGFTEPSGVTAARVVVRSRLAGPIGEDGHGAWLPRPRAKFDDGLAAASAWARQVGTRLVLWPHAGDVLSDAPSVLTLFRNPPSNELGFLLDPAGLFTPEMTGRWEEHLERIFAHLAQHPR